MNKYLVTFQGEKVVYADSQLQAELDATFDCDPDICYAELLDGEEPE